MIRSNKKEEIAGQSSYIAIKDLKMYLRDNKALIYFVLFREVLNLGEKRISKYL